MESQETLSEPIGAPLEGHDSIIYDLAFDPSGTRIASASIDRSVRLWDYPKREEIGHQEVDEVLKAVAFHPSGRLLATGGSAGKIKFSDRAGAGQDDHAR